MNKTKFNELLMNKTGYTKEQIDIIQSVIDNHFIIGKNNKEKIITDFIEQLDIDYDTADELYNTCMGIIMNGIKNKIKHPFKEA